MASVRNRAFDMVKVIATIFILFHHYEQVALMVTGQNVQGLPINFFGGTFYWGYIVELFFLLSGFFMMPYIQKVQKGLSFYRFYTQRAARLLPLVAVSSVCCAIFLLLYDKAYRGSFWTEDPSFFGILIQSMGVQAGWAFKNPYLNNPTWYCSVLMLCYLIFYGIVYWARRLQISPCYGFIFMVFLGCSVQTFLERQGNQLGIPFLDEDASRGYCAFFAGVLLAILFPRLKKWRGTFWMGLAFLILFATAYYKKNGALQYMPFLLTFLLYPAILLLVQKEPFTCISQIRVWEFLSKISYGVFIWHFPLYILMYSVVKIWGIDPIVVVNWPTMIFCVLVLQLIGWFSYRFLECPLNRKALEFFTNFDPVQIVEDS